MSAPPEKKKSEAAKGQREADQVRQIASSHGGKITASQSGSHAVITITCFGRDPESPETRAMLYAIEFAIRGRFDRGRSYQGMTQFTARSRVIDVLVRCMS
jgi:hypothetical protein